MSAVPKRKLTVEEYLAIEEKAEFKSEFLNGEMFAMAGGTPEHNIIKDNLVLELGNRLKGTGCRTMSSDQRVRIDRSGLFVSDIVIVCGPPEYDGTTLLNPRVVIEVLSESTDHYDRSTKFRHYQQQPSIREYVLVAQDEPVVERFVRQDDGSWVFRVFTDPNGSFSLVNVQAEIPLADVYRDVNFPPPP